MFCFCTPRVLSEFPSESVTMFESTWKEWKKHKMLFCPVVEENWFQKSYFVSSQKTPLRFSWLSCSFCAHNGSEITAPTETCLKQWCYRHILNLIIDFFWLTLCVCVVSAGLRALLPGQNRQVPSKAIFAPNIKKVIGNLYKRMYFSF